MKYEFKIDNAPEENGTIDLLRLTTIAEGIRRISEGALQIRLKGVSLTKGRKMISLKDALKVSLTGIKEGSAILNFEAEEFSKTLEPFQTDIFRMEARAQIGNDLVCRFIIWHTVFEQHISPLWGLTLLALIFYKHITPPGLALNNRVAVECL